MRALFLGLSIFLSSVAQAVPVSWTLNDVVLSDGGTVSGSFSYDADTNTYSDLNVSAYVPSVLIVAEDQNLSFGGLGSGWSTPFTMNLNDWYESGLELFMRFDGNLSNSGGTLNILSYGDGTLSGIYDSELNGGPNPSSYYQVAIIGGSVSTVPVPAAVWLFGSALLGLGWLRRKPTV